MERQPITINLKGELDAMSVAVLHQPAASPTNTSQSQFSLLLVGFTKNNSSAVAFRALNVSTFGPEDLQGSLLTLLHATIDELKDFSNEDFPDIEFHKLRVHWAPVAGIMGTTDLTESWARGYKDITGPNAEYDILKLAAGRGMGDVLMVDYTILP